MRRRRRTGCSFLILLLASLLILSGAWLYTTWRSGEAVLPPNLRINGQSMGGMTRQQALNAIEMVYTVPVSVTYNGEPIPPLLPEIIELRVDMAATSENLDEAIANEAGGQAFVRYVIDQALQREPEVIDVNAVVLYSRERVNAFLERTAQKYDHPPLEAVALPEAATFRPPLEGTTLDIEASLPLLIDAILAADPAERHVALVVETEPPPDVSTEVLVQALNASLSDFGGVAGIFAKGLKTGLEVCINCDVAFAGLSTMKIPIGLETYRIHETPLAAETASLLTQMLTESDNAAANRLLAKIGTGDPYTGVLRVTDFVGSLGLQSTYLAAPYDLRADVPAPNVATPANVRTDIATNPDPYIQTTPLEIGMLLESIYHCARGGGCLRALYPREITPAKCQDLLALMERNEIEPLAGQGMPPGTRIAHKHGWRGDTHADVSIVYGPKADFVLAIFLYQPEWLVWEESVPTFAEIGQLTYRFFNGTDETLADR